MSESTMFEVIDVKYEMSGADPELDPEQSSSNSNRRNYDPVHSEEKESDDIEFIFQQCDRNCETCQKYIRKLREHVRAMHGGECQIIPDPLHIEVPSVTEQSSAVLKMKCEVEEVESMDCASGAEIVFHTGDNNESENNSDNSTTVTPKSSREKSISKKYPSTHTREECDEVSGSDTERDCDSDNDSDSDYIEEKQLPKKVERKKHAAGRTYKCEECDKSFTGSTNWKQHMRTHTGERPYECDECAKRFAKFSVLVRHKRSHTAERAFKCDQCERSFASGDALTHHKKIHSFTTYNCDACAKSFTSKRHLNRHKKIHIGERPYKCDECDKSFTQSGTLSRHKKTHTGVRPYECDQCEKTYTRADTLNDHKKTHNDTDIISD